MNKEAPEITPEMLQQHPELLVVVMLVFGLFAFYFAGAIGSWIFFGFRAATGQPLIATEPWRPRAWGLVDFLLVAIAVVIGQMVCVILGARIFGIDMAELRAKEDSMSLSLVFLSGLGNLLAMVAIVGWIVLRFGETLSHAGFVGRRLPKHLFAGLLAGLAMLPLIYALMIAVSVGMKTDYKHPLLEEITKEGSIGAYLLGFATAAIFAPVTEEFLFRVVLQGWLQSIPFKSPLANLFGAWPTWLRNDAALAAVPGEPQLSAAGVGGENALADATAAGTFEGNPYRTSHADASAPAPSVGSEGDDVSGELGSPNLVPPIWPSVVAGTLFGLAHWGYGLSFIPLILMGIVLGLVYRATHSIWPCILIHCMLNSTSMLLLGMLILQQNAAGG